MEREPAAAAELPSRNIDVLILGGGIYGAAVAFEASRRGLTVLLVERGDFGSGASANSLKIMHGGLRYLQSLDIRRSVQSVRDRRRLQLLAPHIVRPIRCRLHTEGRSGPYLLLFRAGLLVNELVSIGRNHGLNGSHRLPLARFPFWWDVIAEDTERLLLSFLTSAVHLGRGRCVVANYTEVEAFERHQGAVVGARIAGLGDVEVGCTVFCVGAHRRGQPAGVSMNVIVDQLPLTAGGDAVALAHPGDRRNVFVVPWRGRTMIGTWDRPYPFDTADRFRFDDRWLDEFLDWLRPVHPDLHRLQRGDVRFVHAGLLPLEREGEPTLRRHHVIERGPDRSLQVVGVKYTSGYGVAVETLQEVERVLGRVPARRTKPAPPPRLSDHRADLEAYLDHDPLRRRALHPALPALARGAVEYAVEREWARTIGDVLLRRTGVASAGHPGREVVDATATVMQPRLGWSPEERQRQVEAFNAEFHFAGSRVEVISR